MNRRPVDSNIIKSVGYDSNNMILEIEFKTDKVYQYYSVPVHVYTELMQSTSIGTYFSRNVKNSFTYKAMN